MTGSPQSQRQKAGASSSRAAALKKQACDSCYKKKIYCDNASPHCNWCSHHGIACTYARPPKLRKPRSSNVTRVDNGKTELTQRLERLEELVSRAVGNRLASRTGTDSGSLGTTPPEGQHIYGGSPSCSHSSPLDFVSPPAPSSSTNSFPGASYGKLHFAGFQLGDINSVQGIPLFSSEGCEWIQERTDVRPSFPSLGAVPLWQNQQDVANGVAIANGVVIAPSSTLGMPDRNIAEAYFELFKNSSLNHVFPVVYIPTFHETIALAYSQPITTQFVDVLEAQACVLSFICVLRFFGGNIEDAPIDGELCATQAQQLMPRILLQTSVTSLQVVLMLGIYHMFSGHMQLASVQISCAGRLVYLLGAHVLCPSREDGTDLERYRADNHLRRLFWLCYTTDKDISLRTGQPPCLEDEYCDTTRPDNYQDLKTARWDAPVVNPHDSESWALFVPGDLELSLIKAKTGKSLYTAKSLKKLDAELLRDIRELDDELENWRMSIKKEWRPSLIQSGSPLHCGISQADVNDMSPAQTMQTIINHFEYYYLMATIHSATSRCKVWANIEDGDIDGVGSSLELTVQASRSTLFYLRASVHSLLGEAFWMVLFYPMTAIVTIFCNILLKPRNPQAQDDLVLLKTASDLIKQMRTRRLTPKETLHMKLVEDFIAELIKLGHCAITKSQ